MSEIRASSLSSALKTDFLSSIVVFLVALPLCLGVSLASGVPLAAGLVTGIIGGILVGLISGSPLQVSGPAAGLTAIVFEISQKQGLEALGVIVLLSGVIQIVAATLRLGQWFRAVSPAVIHGMLAGIGILIVLSQLHAMVDARSAANGFENFKRLPDSYSRIFSDWTSVGGPIIIATATLISLILWNLFIPKKLKILPGPLAAIVLGTIFAYAFPLPGPVKKVDVPLDFMEAIRLPTSGFFDLLQEKAVWISALTVAIVASAETLLCAGAVDRMHDGVKANYNRELSAQGIGNAICGLLGALPMTGVIVRSAANVQAGAKTRLSAILHGVWLLALAWFFPNILNLIPKCCLAAVLVYTGIKLVDIHEIRELRRFGRAQVLIYFLTAGTIVATDLLTGVVLGLALAMAHLLYTFASLSIQTSLVHDGEYRIVLEGAATFLSLPKLSAALERLPTGVRQLHVDLQAVEYFDHASLELLNDWRSQNRSMGRHVFLEWGSNRPGYDLGSEYDL